MKKNLSNIFTASQIKKHRTYIVFVILFLLSYNSFAQIVNIPDATFKSILVSNAAINTNGDGEIQVSEAVAYTRQIYLINPAITDLTGLEAFVNIDSLTLNGLSNITNPNLDLSANVAIKCLYVQSCMLTGLNVSSCDSLDYLVAQVNNFSSLDLSHNNLLTVVFASGNPTLSTINLTGDSLITDLYLDQDQLATVDVSTLHSLVTFGITNNPLTNIDLTHNPLLNYFGCDYTNLTTLDVSQNHSLSHLFCRHCSLLSSINIQNTIILYSVYLSGISSPNLSCVQVDSVAYAVANWGSSFDPGVNFSTNCFSGVGIDEIKNNSTIQVYPNPANDRLQLLGLSTPVKYEIISLQGSVLNTGVVSAAANGIELTTLSNGCYLLQLQDERFTSTSKLMIVH